jgi:hypothetical protein
MSTFEWHTRHENLVTLTAYMADNGYSAKELAAVVEKPWNYEDLWNEAKEAERD